MQESDLSIVDNVIGASPDIFKISIYIVEEMNHQMNVTYLKPIVKSDKPSLVLFRISSNVGEIESIHYNLLIPKEYQFHHKIVNNSITETNTSKIEIINRKVKNKQNDSLASLNEINKTDNNSDQSNNISSEFIIVEKFLIKEKNDSSFPRNALLKLIESHESGIHRIELFYGKNSHLKPKKVLRYVILKTT